MFDALQDTPRDFQTKLIDALNSLSQTMEIAPEDAFNQVLCASNDKNQDVKKKLYNWWRAFFEVLGKIVGNMPKVKSSEFTEKMDDLMAEIMKSGDKESSGSNEVVLEDYEEADKAEEDEMNKDFDFAVQHIGEIANKVKDIVNFVNPYCENVLSESKSGLPAMLKSMGEIDGLRIVDGKVFGNSAVLYAYLDSRMAFSGTKPYKMWDRFFKRKMDGFLKGTEWEYDHFGFEDEDDGDDDDEFKGVWIYLKKLNGFTEEVKNTMKFKKIDERTDGGSDEWLSADEVIGLKVGEADNGEDFWKAMDDVDGLERKGYWSGKFKVGDKVMWNDPEYDEWTGGWTVVSIGEEGFDVYDDKYTIKNDDGSEAEVLGCELRLATTVNEANDVLSPEEFCDRMLEDAENIDVDFSTYDSNVIDDETVALNVTVYRDEISDEEVEAEFKDMPTKYGWEYDSYAYSNEYNVEEGTKDILVYFRPMKQKMDEASVVVDANDVWDVLDLLDDEKANKTLTDLINSHVRTEDEIMDAIDSYVERYWSGKITKKGLVEIFTKYMYEIVDSLGLDAEKFKRDGQFVEPEKPVALEGSDDKQKPDEIKDGEKKYKKDGETKTLVTGADKDMSDKEASEIMGGASETDMDAADMGLVSHKVADPYNKQKVNEMTIEQEIDNPWRLLELLWGQGQENFRDLLESELIDDDTLMMMLEDMEIKNLTSINDAFAYDFPTMLDAFGLDGEAWSQNLEIKRKED